MGGSLLRWLLCRAGLAFAAGLVRPACGPGRLHAVFCYTVKNKGREVPERRSRPECFSTDINSIWHHAGVVIDPMATLTLTKEPDAADSNAMAP